MSGGSSAFLTKKRGQALLRMFTEAVFTILDVTMGDMSNARKAMNSAEYIKSNSQMTSGFLI